MKDSKKSSLLGHRLRFRWLFLFSLFAGPLALPLGGQSAIAANNIAQQQKVSVTGKVVDNLGEPIIGASVVVKGTSNGTITDFEGNFQLNTEKKGSLVISYIGYVTKEVTIKPTLKIVLAEDTKALDEVVVVGYGTQKKSDLTGSVTSVKAAEITAVTSNNPLESLQGRAPGVAVFTNNAPGESPILRIRGAGSIQSGNDPLYVVDGFPLMNGSLNDINPADIASMEILKDASSTAIYGSRGANGVVLITTKSGSTGRKNLSVNASFGIQSAARLVDLLETNQFIPYINEAYENRVRSRALLPVSSASTQSDVREAIIKERRVELAFENKRWLDLVRTGSAEQVMKSYGERVKANPSAYYFPEGFSVAPTAFTDIRILFPLPASEAALSPYF